MEQEAELPSELWLAVGKEPQLEASPGPEQGYCTIATKKLKGSDLALFP